MKIEYSKVLILSVLAIFLLQNSNFNHTVNQTIIRSTNSIFSSEKVNENIVLIEISDNDIDQLGGFPIKRSFYALLIERLNQLEVNAIGLEVFLSPKISKQSIYDKVLDEAISTNKNIVLSSLAGSNQGTNQLTEADTVKYPQPKFTFPDLKTGHINYYEENGIIIPSYFRIDKKLENAFAYELAKFSDHEKISTGKLNININHSWKDFASYSLLEFFRLDKNSEKVKNQFQGKTVIIGVSADKIAPSLKSYYDDSLPGFAIHAFALENILHNNLISKSYSNIFTYLAISLVIVAAFFFKRNYQIIFLCIGFLLLTEIILFSFFNYQINLIVPIFLLVFSAVIDFVYKSYFLDKQIEETVAEKEKVESKLIEKERELISLRTSLNNENSNKQNELIDQIKNLKSELNEIKQQSKQDLESETPTDKAMNFYGIVYASTEMQKIIEVIQKAAKSDAPILILGESGSGKELVAKAIHENSHQKDRAFIAVNCAAITESLLESELFGHVKGAFTNAYKDKQGRFEQAKDGTIFLDEIGETSDNFQSKLLRVIQNGEYEKVGSGEKHYSNARVIAATNKNIVQLVEQKKFREDLYYRLNIIQIEIPPLRKRKSDIPHLVNHFVENEKNVSSVSKSVMDILCKNDWKGNIRELEATIKHASIFASSENRDMIQLKDLPQELSKLEEKDSAIWDLLLSKEFSHSSINETAKELSLSRTVVSETLRGIIFEEFVKTQFDLDKTIEILTSNTEEEATQKLYKKAETYIKNIKRDISKNSELNFEKMKSKFGSKYKNLPVKYHLHLDEIIRYYLSELPENKNSGN